MRVIRKGIITEREEPETARVFRNLHEFTKDPYISSFSEDGTDIQVLAEFENVIDELIADFESIENGGEATFWFLVDDEFTKDELLMAKNEMEKMREENLTFIEVILDI